VTLEQGGVASAGRAGDGHGLPGAAPAGLQGGR
jgi:hypothetical protein